jgi:hypothetical protein
MQSTATLAGSGKRITDPLHNSTNDAFLHGLDRMKSS